MKGENKMTLINREKPYCNAPSCTHGGQPTPKSSYKPTYAPSPLPTYDPTSGPTQPTSLVAKDHDNPAPKKAPPIKEGCCPDCVKDGDLGSSHVNPNPKPKKAPPIKEGCCPDCTADKGESTSTLENNDGLTLKDLSNLEKAEQAREAVSKAHEEIVHLLINTGADVNAKNKQGVTIAPPSLPSRKIKVKDGRIVSLDSANREIHDFEREFAKPFQLSDNKIRGIDSNELFLVHRTSSPTRTADDFADQSNSPSADQSNSPSIETTCCTIA